MKPHRFFASTVVLVALATTVPSVAEEGDRGGRRGRFRGPPRRPTVSASMLLRSPKVREELKVSDEQAKKIDEIQAAQRGKMRELFSDDDLSRKERHKKAKAFHKEADAAVVSALAEDQAKRLNEIVLQQRGVDGLVSDDVVTELQLDDDQLSKIKAAIVARNVELRKLRPPRRRRDADGNGDRDKHKDAREKAEKLFKSTEATIVALLSEGQREAFEELKGVAVQARPTRALPWPWWSSRRSRPRWSPGRQTETPTSRRRQARYGRVRTKPG